MADIKGGMPIVMIAAKRGLQVGAKGVTFGDPDSAGWVKVAFLGRKGTTTVQSNWIKPA